MASDFDILLLTYIIPKTKKAVDFPFPGGRTAQRAYFDACRDLLGPAFGYRVIRIPAPSRNVMAAVAALREALEA